MCNKYMGKKNMKIIGVEIQKGIYNDKEWRNYYLTIQKNKKKESDEIWGIVSNGKPVKVKPEIFDTFLKVNGLTQASICGKDVEFFYDRFGNLSQLALEK